LRTAYPHSRRSEPMCLFSSAAPAAISAKWWERFFNIFKDLMVLRMMFGASSKLAIADGPDFSA
jgi:hypothetical protein